MNNKLQTYNTMKHTIQNYRPAQASCIYGLGFIGAAVYFISHASGFWFSTIGFLKALVWPAFLVYEAFTRLGI